MMYIRYPRNTEDEEMRLRAYMPAVRAIEEQSQQVGRMLPYVLPMDELMLNYEDYFKDRENIKDANEDVRDIFLRMMNNDGQ